MEVAGRPLFSAPGPQTLTPSDSQQAGLTPGRTHQAGILRPVGKILVESLLPGGHSPAQGAKWPQREREQCRSLNL